MDSIETSGGRATGVRLASGQRIKASIHPSRAHSATTPHLHLLCKHWQAQTLQQVWWLVMLPVHPPACAAAQWRPRLAEDQDDSIGMC